MGILNLEYAEKNKINESINKINSVRSENDFIYVSFVDKYKVKKEYAR